MGFARRSPLVLVAILAVLAGAIDGCLLDCHTPTAVAGTHASAHARCHQQAGMPSTQLRADRWQPDPTCHHDHTSVAAEGTASNRLDWRAMAIVVSLAAHLDRPAAWIFPVIRSTAGRSRPTVALVPLRI